MPRARWWAVGALALLTLTVVLLDATGVIFDSEPEVSPPPPLVLPAPLDPGAGLASPLAAADADPPAGVVRQVRRALEEEALGPSVHAVVAPLASPSGPWLDVDGDELATPASTVKLWTAIAVLDGVPSWQRLSTSAFWDAASSSVILVGGGDATLETDPSRGSAAGSGCR